MDVFEAIKSRRSIRKYKSKEVEREKFMTESLLKRFCTLSIGRL